MVNKPSITDPQGADVTPGEGGENVTPQGDNLTLEEINTLMSREYKSIEEARKGMKEQTSYIGELGPKAAEFDKIEAAKSSEEKNQDANVATSDKIAKMEFGMEHPDAKGYSDDVQAIAKQKGVSMSEAYKDSAFEKMVQQEQKLQKPASPEFVEGGRLPEGEKGITKEQIRSMPIEDAKKMVEALPSWNRPISQK
jgi:hypothetical protein|tara:strand:- start:1559 stop:2146 length:588 start_codon:yes stop_codon:yes gene_type:complete